MDLGDMSMPSTKGSLLVAVPLLDDPNFHRTVVYMLQHTDDGALGLIINRPSELDLVPGLDSWMDELAPPQIVFDGGPVHANTLIAIASMTTATFDTLESDGVTEGFAPLDHGLGTVDLSLLASDIAESLQHLRVFRGYSGWGPGQLEDEISEGSWLAIACEASDLFTPNPLGLWRNVLRRSGGREALLADAPDDLAWN
ncbi:MAG: YqgE/AlgH family protein [Ilumatobacteraceae bacterium]